jgi:Mce-associated membrane protein
MTTVDQAAPEPVGASSTRLGWPVRLAIGAVALAVIGATLVAVVMAKVSSNTDQVTADAAASYLAGANAQAAKAAAVREVTATLTYNYKTLQADFARAEQGLTPRFRTSYEHTTATSVAPLARKYDAISSSEVSAAGTSSISPTTATVLVFANQTVQNTQLAHPRLDRSRIRVSMAKVDGTWLVDNLIPL